MVEQTSRTRLRHTVVLSCLSASVLCDAIALVVFYGFLVDWTRWFEDMSVTAATGDVFIIGVLRLLFIIAAVFLKRSYRLSYLSVYWMFFSLNCVLFAKLFVFQYELAAASGFLGFSCIIATLELYFLPRYVPVQCKVDEEDMEDGKVLVEGLEEGVGREEEPEAENGVPWNSYWRLLKPYFWPKGILNKLRCFSTWVFLSLSRAANLVSPLFIGSAVTKLASPSSNSLESVLIDLGVFCVLRFANGLFKQLQNLVYLKVKMIAYTEIAEDTFRHLHSLSLDWHLRKKMGKTLRSMDRGVAAANTVVSSLFLSLLPSVGECIAVIVIFYTTFNIAFLSATIFLSISCYAVFTVQVTLWRKQFREKSNLHDNSYHDKATDTLINYETVKYFTAERFELSRYLESIVEFQKYSRCTLATLHLLNIGQQLIITCSLFTCLYIITVEIYEGRATVGEFVTIQQYVLNLFAPLSFLGSIYNAVVEAGIDMDNLLKLLQERPDLTDAEDAVELITSDDNNGASIEYSNVSFHYPTQDPESGLKDITFKIEPGTATGIVGHTGSGKTTLGRLLFRFYDPLEGSILIAGQDIAHVTQLSLRQSIGVVPQDCVLFNESLLFNLRYGKQDATFEEIEEVCRSANVLDFIRSLPEGFYTRVGERGLKLSGGEKQRVAIARCLLKNPPIVILDEATSALDNVTEVAVQEALNTLSENRTTLTIAHRLTTIQRSEQIVVLDSGHIIERGRHEELLAIPDGIYKELWTVQQNSA